MSRLHDLIQQLCPNGVPYKPLGEVAVMARGAAITRKTMQVGDIPVIAGGQKPAYYCAEPNRMEPCVTVAGSGAYAGFIAYWEVPIFVSDAFSVTGTEAVATKFLYYVLKNMQERIYATKKGGGVPHVHISSISHFRIPVPPMAVQEEIVRILDCFTALEAELEAELEARKKQYAYWRERLLTFDDEAAKIPCGLQTDRQTDRFAWRRSPAQWVTLGDVFEMKNGYTPSKREKSFWENGTIPWFRMEDIRANGRILSDSIQHITLKAVKKGKLFPANSIIMATTATIGEHALVIVDSLANQRFTFFTKRESFADKLDMRFAYYYFFLIGEWCKQNVVVSSFPSVDMDRLRNLRFPLPSLAEQGRIVGILDKFEALCGDLSAGLPGEIALRRKQFAYWRERLLDFKEIGA